jgi:hypothetical protein
LVQWLRVIAPDHIIDFKLKNLPTFDCLTDFSEKSLRKFLILLLEKIPRFFGVVGDCNFIPAQIDALQK